MQNRYIIFITFLLLATTINITRSCAWNSLPTDIQKSILRYILDIPAPFLKSNYEEHFIPNPDLTENFAKLGISDFQKLTHVYDWYSFDKRSAVRYLLVNKQWQHLYQEIMHHFNNEHSVLSIYNSYDLDALTVISFLCDKKIYGNDIHTNWIVQKQSSMLTLDINQRFLNGMYTYMTEHLPQTHRACYCSLWDNIKEGVLTVLFQGLSIEKDGSHYPMFFTLYQAYTPNGFNNDRSIRNHNGKYTFEGFFKTIIDLTKGKYPITNYGTLSYDYMLLSYKAVSKLDQYIDQYRTLPNQLTSENVIVRGETTAINNNTSVEVVCMICVPVTKLSMNFMIGVLQAAGKIPYS